MSRNGAGVYSLPPIYEAVPGETILATQHNTPLQDLEADANNARPIVAGGTGGDTAVGAADNLSTASNNIASASTTNLANATGVNVTVTGTTTITAFGTVQSGAHRYLTFSGALILTHNATSLILPGGRNIITAAGDVAIFVSEGGGNWRCVSYTRTQDDFIHVVDEKSSGTNGGTSVIGSQLRTLNTVKTNTIPGASLASNEVTLPAGTYHVEARAPAYAADRNKLFLAAGATTLVSGASGFAASVGAAVQVDAVVAGRFTLAVTTAVSLTHYFEKASATIGLGIASTIASVAETYTQLKIWRLT